MRFSQRVGIVPATKVFQIDSVDMDLRNRLWNMVDLFYLDLLVKHAPKGSARADIFYVKIWEGFFKRTIDSIPYSYSEARSLIKLDFHLFNWYKIYDFIEYISPLNSSFIDFNAQDYRMGCNRMLEEENSAYRFVDSIIAPITNQSEISEIEEAIFVSGNFTSLQGVNIHLHSALSKLSDKQNPDYRNSIKESISAVESVAKKIANSSSTTLGGALDQIKTKIKIHTAMYTGFKNLYGYTNDSSGIRHALMDETTCDFEDAKFMLVSCSAFINYLIVKADKAGISLS